MAERVLTDCGIYFDKYDLSADHNRIQMDVSAELKVTSAFGDTYRSRIPGARNVDISGGGWWNGGDDNVDDVFFDNLGLADKVMTLAEKNDDGEVSYILEAISGSYEFGEAYGEVLAFGFTASASGNLLVPATVMAKGAKTATGNGTSRQLGAISATQYLYFVYHLTAISGTATPTITLKVQSDDNQGMSSPTDRITTAGLTALVGAWATPVAGAITDDWWRVTWTITGTDPSLTILCSIGIA